MNDRVTLRPVPRVRLDKEADLFQIISHCRLYTWSVLFNPWGIKSWSCHLHADTLYCSFKSLLLMISIARWFQHPSPQPVLLLRPRCSYPGCSRCNKGQPVNQSSNRYSMRWVHLYARPWLRSLQTQRRRRYQCYCGRESGASCSRGARFMHL